jgi:endo-1,4-beta-mannosidase
MEALFGARLVDANPKDEVTLRVVAPFGNLKVGDTFHYSVPTATQRSWGAVLEVKGGTVIAVDQDNRPALVSNTLGSGKTLLSAYPLESYLASAPAAFDKPENAHRIYEAFREWAGVRPLFHSDQPSVEVSSLSGGGRGYAVVTNHGPEPQSVRVTASAPLHAVTKITADGIMKVQVAGTTFKVDIEAYEGLVFEWQ